jgi:uncharacterized protein YjbI with pentapeptide repeats
MINKLREHAKRRDQNLTSGLVLQVPVVIGTAFLMATIASVPSHAANPAHIQQLLQTRECARCDLAGADLSDAHLIGADLREANLEGANLAGANLEGADLTGANLQRTLMTGTFLTNAALNRSNMANANLSNAIAYHADTRGANLSNMMIAGAQIFGSGISIGGDEDQQPEELLPQTQIISVPQLMPAPQLPLLTLPRQ